MTDKKAERVDADVLRRRAENVGREQTAQLSENAKTLSPEETRLVLNELRTHQIELEMQNEELRRAQEELDAERERYFDLYDLAPVGYCTISEKGMILEANLTAATLLGQSRGSLVKKPLSSFIHKEDQDAYYLFRKQLFETDERRTCELRMLKTDASLSWVRMEAAAAMDADGSPTCRVILIDITEHKQVEEFQAFLAQTSSGTIDKPFFQAMAQYLAQSLGMDFVCIDRLEGDGLTARTVAVWCDGQFEDNVTYALKDTPCGDVVGKDVCCFPASVCQFFPRDQVLKDLRAESYAGATLWSHSGQPIGLIAIIGRSPLANRTLAESMLKLVSARAAGELERLDAEESLRKSEERVQKKLQSILSPDDDLGALELADIIDVDAIQQLMNYSYQLTHIPNAILDLEGNVLVSTGWQDICTKFHRIHPETLSNCTECDTVLNRDVQPGTFKAYLCKNSIWDCVTPLMVGGRHVGNLFIGQFFFEGEKPDDGIFRAQAAKYGFDEEEYMAALARVPIWERETINTAFKLYITLANMVTSLSHRNITLARMLEERKRTERVLRESEERLDMAQDAAKVGVWDWDIQSGQILWSKRMFYLFGLDPLQTSASFELWESIVYPEDLKIANFRIKQSLKEKTTLNSDYRVLTPDGQTRWINAVGQGKYDDQGQPIRMVGICVDITDRKRADEALRGSQEWLSMALDVGHAGIWEWNIQSDKVSFDARFHEMLGYTPGDLPSTLQEWKSYHHPDDMEVMFSKTKAFFRGESTTYESEHRIRAKSGVWNWIFTRGRLVNRTDTEPPERFIGIAINTTERKRIEEELRESRSALNRVLDTVPQSIFWKDTEGRYLGCNRVFATAVGFDNPDTIIGKTDFDLPWPKEDAEAYRADDREVIETNRPKLHIIEQLKQADGTQLWIDTSKVPIRDTDGQPFAVLGVYDDITQRMRIEEARKRLSDIVERSLNEIYVFDCESLKFIHVNPIALKNLQYTSQEIANMTPLDIKPEFTEARFRTMLQPLLTNTLEMLVFHTFHRRADASLYPVEIHLQLMGAGANREFLAVIFDITERKRAEEDKVKLEEQLFQAQKMESVGRLAGGVAHDFNNMLSVILGHAEMALQDLDPAHSLRADLEEIRKAATRSADLTRQLLAFARKQTVTPKVLDLNETVEGMLKMLKRLIGEDISLVWQPQANLWPVKMDPSQIDQILANLCVNARDAIAGVGKLTIESDNVNFDDSHCAIHQGFLPGDYVRLAVSDNGCGMDKATLEHLFEPFFTTKVLGKGTGLGLATVYGAVKQNNGFINVYSEPGHGTTFTIYLPRHMGKAEQMKKDDPAEANLPGNETILLVEDEPSVLKLTKEMLESLGYKVLAASTPGEAIRLAREHASAIHLLMTDVVMPEMNGRDLAKNLLKLYPHLKRIFMSGYTADVIAYHGVLEEGVHFIQKPFSTKKLAAAVREALEHE